MTTQSQVCRRSKMFWFFLPNSSIVDLKPSLEQIIKRGRTLGFAERHYFTTFKLFIQKHFSQYNSVLTGLRYLTTFWSSSNPTMLAQFLRTAFDLSPGNQTKVSLSLEQYCLNSHREQCLRPTYSTLKVKLQNSPPINCLIV